MFDLKWEIDGTVERIHCFRIKDLTLSLKFSRLIETDDFSLRTKLGKLDYSLTNYPQISLEIYMGGGASINECKLITSDLLSHIIKQLYYLHIRVLR